MQLLAPFADPRTYRRFAYLVTALPLGAVGLAVLIAGWALTLALAITPLVVPALIGLRAAVGTVAQAEAWLARVLLGVDAARPSPSSGGSGFFGRAGAILRDGDFWRQQSFLLLRFAVGWPFAVVQLSLLAAALGLIGAPVYYWSIPDGIEFGLFQADTFPVAAAVVPAGLVLLLAPAWTTRPLAAAFRRLAASLLDGTLADVLPDEVRRARRVRAFRVHAAATGAVSAVLVTIWALTPSTPFWPVFPMLVLGLALAVHGWALLVEERQDLWRGRRMTRPLILHLGVSAALVLFFVGIWAATTRGYFWPVWPFLALGLVAAVHTLFVLAHPSPEAELTERIEQLETTRAGAVDVQEHELRRIERDLHDGAQARLVALGMSLGLAEQRLDADPEGARRLVTEARLGVGEALEELRDLVRGIHPPLLTDRGLETAITALAERSAVPASAKVDVADRPPPAVETAAYFVAAEALANAGKHAGASRVVIDVLLRGGVLDVQVADDGAGGADARGTGLTGLRRRVEALDGTFAVASPAGGPTIVHARLPCAS